VTESGDAGNRLLITDGPTILQALVELGQWRCLQPSPARAARASAYRRESWPTGATRRYGSANSWQLQATARCPGSALGMQCGVP